MDSLFSYQDYVDRLTHPSNLVRRWAFEAIEERYPSRYTPQVARLIGDPDEHLACSAPKYLANHGAIDLAPVILESFMRDQGNVPSNCAIALGMMGYKQAKEKIIERLTHCESSNTLFGITYYLGKIRDKDCHEVLRDVFRQMNGHYFVDIAAQHLLEHNDPQDVPTVLDVYFRKADHDHGKDMFLRRLMDSVGAGEIYDDLADANPQNLLEAPRGNFEEMLSWHPMIDPGLDIISEIIGWIENLRYQDVVTALVFDARKIMSSRYPNEECPGYYQAIFEKDRLAGVFLDSLSKRSVRLRRGAKDRKAIRNFLAAVLACYFSIQERGGYLSSLEPDATLEDMMTALKRAGSELPGTIQGRLIALGPIEPLRSALTDQLDTWGDIWTVRLMRQIGDGAFVPDLIRVLRDTDGLSYIHEDAIRALRGMDESVHEKILACVEKGEVGNAIDIFSILEHLPYARSFEIARRLWDEDEMDSFEMYATCLEGIGDARGIEALREIFYEGNAIFVGDSLEVLCLLHERGIPELAVVRHEREKAQERRRKRMLELNDLARKVQERRGTQASLKGQPGMGSVRRKASKIGRNAPCPCGSGKKYKKCCMERDRGA